MNIDKSIKKIIGKNNVSRNSTKPLNAMGGLQKSAHFSSFKFSNIINFKKFGGKKDWDGDGVLNKFDCQPRNVMRQDRRRRYTPDRTIPGGWERHTKEKDIAEEILKNDSGWKEPPWALIQAKKRKKEEEEIQQQEYINEINRQFRTDEDNKKYDAKGYKLNKVTKKLIGDKDGDGVNNVMDCDPNDKNKQGFIHNGFAHLYHGTKSSNHVAIQKQGLIPFANYWGEPAVFLTASKKHAMYHASKNNGYMSHFMKNKKEDKPVLLEVKVPLEQVSKYTKEDIYDDNNPIKQILVHQKIPPNNIKIIKPLYEKGWEDNDKDGIINAEDCEPNNPNKQGNFHSAITLFYTGVRPPSETIKNQNYIYGFSQLRFARGWQKKFNLPNIWQFVTTNYVLDKKQYVRDVITGKEMSDNEYVVYNIISEQLVDKDEYMYRAAPLRQMAKEQEVKLKPYVYASVDYVDRLAIEYSRRYNIDLEDMRELISDTADYNVNDENDVRYILETELIPKYLKEED